MADQEKNVLPAAENNVAQDPPQENVDNVSGDADALAGPPDEGSEELRPENERDTADAATHDTPSANALTEPEPVQNRNETEHIEEPNAFEKPMQNLAASDLPALPQKLQPAAATEPQPIATADDAAPQPALPSLEKQVLEQDFSTSVTVNGEAPNEQVPQFAPVFMEESVRFSDPQPLEDEPQQDVNDENLDDDALLEEQIMDPDHPLLARVQEALKVQLTTQIEKVRMEILELEDQAKQTTKKREGCGVELYAAQQELARLQASLESSEDNIITIRKYREEAELKLRQNLQVVKAQQESLKLQKKNLEQHQIELDKINRAIKQVDLYNEEMRSKILIAKRTTLKAEAEIIKQELEKKRQDYFIDNLTGQIQQMAEKRALYESQLAAQQLETKAAMDMLQESMTEIEAIQFEKRQLHNQWKSGVIGLQRREEVIMQVQASVNANKDQVLSLKNELSGFRIPLKKAQEESEFSAALLAKIDGDVDMMKAQIANLTDSQNQLKETHSMYFKSLNQCEVDFAQAMSEHQRLRNEIASLTKSTQQVKRETQKLENDIADELQLQFALDKGQAGSRKDMALLRDAIHEKETTNYSVENAISAAQLEMLGVLERIDAMKKELERIDKEANARNKLIESYEQDLRNKETESEKKQAEIEQLNKKFDQLTSGTQDESMGPLEATIHNLLKNIATKEKECVQLSQYWLRSQTELVNLGKRSNHVADETHELKMKLSVLDRKKMVLNSAFDNEEKEIKEHRRNLKQLQTELTKINQLLARQSHIQNKLEENNLELEQEFRSRLKQAELDALKSEQKVEELKESKEKSVKGLVEAERQIMLWEKKIQLAKETRSALDPAVGLSEIQEMTNEIHRMKLRHASLVKTQEQMIKEMEQGIFRRENIASRSKAKGKLHGQAALVKSIADITKKTKQTLIDLAECDNDIANLTQTHTSLKSQLELAQKAVETLQASEHRLLEDLEVCLFKRQMEVNATVHLQKQQRRMADLKEGKYSFLVSVEELRDPELAKQVFRLRKFLDILNYVKEVHSKNYQVVSTIEVLNEFIKEGIECAMEY